MTYIMMIVVPLQVLTDKSLSLRLVLSSEGLYVSTTNTCVSTLQPSTSASNWGGKMAVKQEKVVDHH